jgi:hypothetical protein
VIMSSSIAHHTDRLDREKYDERLPNSVIQPIFMKALNEDFIRFAKKL